MRDVRVRVRMLVNYKHQLTSARAPHATNGINGDNICSMFAARCAPPILVLTVVASAHPIPIAVRGRSAELPQFPAATLSDMATTHLHTHTSTHNNNRDACASAN